MSHSYVGWGGVEREGGVVRVRRAVLGLRGGFQPHFG